MIRMARPSSPPPRPSWTWRRRPGPAALRTPELKAGQRPAGRGPPSGRWSGSRARRSPGPICSSSPAMSASSRWGSSPSATPACRAFGKTPGQRPRHREEQTRQVSASAEQHGDADADDHGDRRNECDGVVLVDDAVHVRQHQPGDDEPRAPHEHGRAEVAGRPPARSGARRRFGPAAATSRLNENEQDDCSQEEEEGGGQEPGDLLAETAGEQPSDAGFAPAASLTSATDGPRLIAGEPAETVVAEGEFEERIRLGAADIGSTVDGGELD